ncbi:hypothetical protein RI129_000523 [Pyrocoelia pectoralis]|uniref:Axonemal dynein light intermediate polypeptide 1 n=1 Tax=Pyrocoelia pectoralis TaxID=417401 RepID=A0AAN7VRR4_9COLE
MAAAERLIPDSSTLVKYDNPVLITKHDDKHGELKDKSSPTRTKSAPPTADERRETEEILNGILPPKEWEEDGQKWKQQVSTTPATRLDVVNLQEQLDMRLQQRQARETGICPVRRELYTQCFDELIRQITINCAERGLLLLRVRDEMKMTMEAYQSLYCSNQIKEEKVDVERQLADLRLKAEQSERRAAELRIAEEKKHSEEIQFLKKTNQQLKTQLEGIIAPKK